MNIDSKTIPVLPVIMLNLLYSTLSKSSTTSSSIVLKYYCIEETIIFVCYDIVNNTTVQYLFLQFNGQ